MEPYSPPQHQPSASLPVSEYENTVEFKAKLNLLLYSNESSEWKWIKQIALSLGHGEKNRNVMVRNERGWKQVNLAFLRTNYNVRASSTSSSANGPNEVYFVYNVGTGHRKPHTHSIISFSFR